MWFSFPPGCGAISVERQEFVAEWTDDNGKGYFRAPDHFAPRILAIQGFSVVETPDGAPADLPKADPLRDSAIAELTGTAQAQRDEIQNLRSDLQAATARVAALSNEKTDLVTKLAVAEAKIHELEEEIEDRPAVEVTKKK